MRPKLRSLRATYRDRHGRRRTFALRGLVRTVVPYRTLAIGLTITTLTLLASHAALCGRWFAAAAQEGAEPGTAIGSLPSDGAAAPDPSVDTQRAQNLAIQSAGITADDLPIDEEGRSAKTGRPIPGIRPRRAIPPEVQQALASLQSRAAQAAESLPTDSEPVVITDLPDDPARRPRMDSIGTDPTSQSAIAPVERNR